jgi:hypothetical protein
MSTTRLYMRCSPSHRKEPAGRLGCGCYAAGDEQRCRERKQRSHGGTEWRFPISSSETRVSSLAPRDFTGRYSIEKRDFSLPSMGGECHHKSPVSPEGELGHQRQAENRMGADSTLNPVSAATRGARNRCLLGTSGLGSRMC